MNGGMSRVRPMGLCEASVGNHPQNLHFVILYNNDNIPDWLHRVSSSDSSFDIFYQFSDA